MSNLFFLQQRSRSLFYTYYLAMHINNQAYIDIHTHTLATDSNIAVYNNISNETLPELPPNTFISIGIHPWYLNDWELQAENIIQNIYNENVIAIGECGFDKYSKFSMKLQEIAFRYQIEIAEHYKKPLIIHCVKAFNELFQIRKATKCTMPWVIHGFTASKEIALKCASEGMFLSFGKQLFTENTRTINVAKTISLQNVLLETDTSELSISDIYAQLSNIRQLSTDELKRTIADNFNRCFNSQY